jgi:hypothetical protein
LLIEEGEVDLLMGHGVVGPAFYPAGALAVVVDAVVVGVGGGGGFEGPGFFDGVLCGPGGRQITGGAVVVAHGHEEERGGVGGGVHVGELLPVDAGSEAVWENSCMILPSARWRAMKNSSSAAGEGEVAVAVDGVEGVEGVAAEEPAEAGAGGVGAGVVAGD